MKSIAKNKIKIKTVLMMCLCFSFHAVFGQDKVEGVVLSGTGDFLENATVSVAGNLASKVFTDKEGKFEIMAGDYLPLVVEYKNIYRKTVKVSDVRQNGIIILDSGSKLINVGNGQEFREEELASSVGYVGRDKIGKVTAYDMPSTMLGQLQGLRMGQNTGPNADNRAAIFSSIRGRATTQDGGMMVLIDGVERPSNTVLPEEIESVTVLRDAAAKARYGQRGANGVLILNTRRGSKGAPQFFASVEQGMTQPTRLPKFLDAASYAMAENEARVNDGLAPRYSEAEIGHFQSGEYPYLYPNVDWIKETLKNYGSFGRYNFGVSGGNDITNYFVSLNYQNDNGLYKHTELNDGFSTQLRNDKINMRTNLDIRVSPTTLVKVNLGGFISINKQPATPGASREDAVFIMSNQQYYNTTRLASSNIVSAAFSIPSALFPVTNEDGSWGGTRQFGTNPVAQISDVGFDTNHIRSFFNEISIKQDLNFILDGLGAEVFGAYYNQADYWENKTKTFAYTEVTPVVNVAGDIIGIDERELGQELSLTSSRYSGNQQRSTYDLRGELTYNKVFDGVHAVNAWALIHQNQYDYHVINQVYRYRNYAANVHYGYDNRYFLDGTVSYSGTNRIQNPKDRFGLFPAVGAAWLISNEPFMKNADFLDMLKLRASYGKTGNGLIDIRDLTSDKYGGGSGYNLGVSHTGISGTRETELGIAQKKFETSLEANIGLDIRLFNKLSFTGEVFSMKRSNIFVPSSGHYSTVLGLMPLTVPEGEVHNKGYELELTWNDRIGDFNYYLGGMFSHYKNEIVNMNEEYRPYDYLKRTGLPVGQIFGWETEGFFMDEADIANRPNQQFGTIKPGDIIYTDQNGDNVIDDYDQVPLGYSGTPEIYYSMSVGFEWRGIEVSALFQGTARSSVLLSQSHVFWPLRGDDNISTWYTNYWSEDNKQGAELPRLTKQSDNNYRTNDIWLRDNSYLKLRYAEVAYSFPRKLISKWGVENLKVYLRGRDLLSFDNIKYVDPENVGATYPSLKSYNIGVALNF